MSASETPLKWMAVATLDELRERKMLEVEVDGEAVLLVHRPGKQILAYQGLCPHREYHLVEGRLDPEMVVLYCAGHHWQFDIRTGQVINPTGPALYRYEVRVEGETISVGYPGDAVQRTNH